jgi:hypothetical protein
MRFSYAASVRIIGNSHRAFFQNSVILPLAVFDVVADVMIAVSLCVLLHGRQTGVRRLGTFINCMEIHVLKSCSSNNIIHTLMVYAVNRCLLTSFTAIAELVTVRLPLFSRTLQLLI